MLGRSIKITNFSFFVKFTCLKGMSAAHFAPVYGLLTIHKAHLLKVATPFKSRKKAVPLPRKNYFLTRPV